MRQKPRKENKELVVKGHLNRVSFCILRNPAVNGERSNKNGIPYELAGRLSGSDEEEIKKDAETMAKFLRKKDVPPLAGGDPQKIDDKKTAMKGMLASLKGE